MFLSPYLATNMYVEMAEMGAGTQINMFGTFTVNAPLIHIYIHTPTSGNMIAAQCLLDD